MPPGPVGCVLPCWFQSAPGREAGRCQYRGITANAAYLFQSAPGREAGRCREATRRPHLQQGFNPRPAVRPGDASSKALTSCGLDVSIRARP